MSYFEKYLDKLTKLTRNIESKMFLEAVDLINETKNKNGKIILAGNGGSASISSHVSVDIVKALGIRSITFNEANLITCFSNDYGYENLI